MAERLYLIDGSALAYRAFYAFIRNPLINSRGENVSAVFGFTKTLLNIIDREAPDYFAVIFDTSAPTFRHERYKEYKAQRADMPEEMVEQLPRIYEMLETLKVPNFSKPGFEADDIMGTLATMASKKGIETILVSGDKDMLQLISDKVKVLNPKRSGDEPEWLDAKSVKEKMGIRPDQIIDYLALVGDSSDNIPGVSGIGPKGAVNLLQEYDRLDTIFKNIDSIANKRARTALKGSDESAFLSKELATIKCDMQLDVNLEDLKLGAYDSQDVVEFFQKVEINSLIERFSERKVEPDIEYSVIDSAEALESLAKNLYAAKRFAFDTETTQLHPMLAELVGLSFSWIPGQAFYVPVKGITGKYRPLELEQVRQILGPVLIDEHIKKCAHNAKYDMLVLDRTGLPVRGLDFDTMIASYLIDPSARQHNLDLVSLNVLGFKKISITSLIGSGKKQLTMDNVEIEKVAKYACEDADITWRLCNELQKQLETLKLEKLFHQVEMPLVTVLMHMEKAGVRIDPDFLRQMSGKLESAMADVEKHIYEMAGEAFNINSPKQLSVILFEKLQLPIVRRTKTGYSTDVNVLETLAEQHDLPKEILNYRQLAKLKSTYVDALPKLIHPDTHRVHSSFNQTITATGRLSSSEPNFQNIPIRTEMGREIRRAFIPRDKDSVILDADYSQIELRIMAHLSKDPQLLEAFKKDEDVHTLTAGIVFNVEPDQVTFDQRRKAKEVNFGIMYGMGAYGLSQRLGITPEEADAFIKTYFANYGNVQNYMTEAVVFARKEGYVTTLLGRRRYIPEINSDNRRIREFAERTAINTPIQGSAADMIKLAMIHIDRDLHNRNLRTQLILQVHDELTFDVPRDELPEIQSLVREKMEGAMDLEVPLKIEMGSADNWLDAH
ncbi:DNA polymerase I [candidate division KSB1 bacterium]|nr:DNA polymerase I [candidate division KSB1 bacterium]